MILRNSGQKGKEPISLASHPEMPELTLRSYLQNSLQSALNQAFPALVYQVKPESFYLCRTGSADLCTPVALQISSIVAIPAEQVARRIMAYFKWNISFVQPDPQLEQSLQNGFINFRVSAQYLHTCLLDSAKQELLSARHSILEKTREVIKHAEVISPGVIKGNPELLVEQEEILLLKAIALLDTDSVWNRSATVLFTNQIAAIFERFYLRHAVFTESIELTYARTQLVRAVHNRICSLLNKAGINDS